MSSETLRPASTIQSTAVLEPSEGTAHGVTSDDSDASYANKARWAPDLILGLDAATKPAGSVLKSFRVRVRLSSQDSAKTTLSWWYQVPGSSTQYGLSQASHTGTSATTYTGATANPGDLSSTQLNSLRVHLRVPDHESDGARIYEVYGDAVYAEKPTVAIISPTSDPTTNVSSLTTEWTFTPGTDGPGQSFFRVKVFRQSQFAAPGFDPDTTVAWRDSGERSGSATSYTLNSLPEGVFRVYIKGAALVNGVKQWSDWDYEGFTVSLSTAEVAAVTSAADDEGGRIELIVDRDAGSDAWDRVEVQRHVGADQLGELGEMKSGSNGLADGWSIDIDGEPTTSLSLRTAGGWSGQYQRLQAVVLEDEALAFFLTDPIKVSPGDAVTFSAMMRGTLGENAELRMAIFFRDSAGTSVGSRFIVLQPADLSSSWRGYSITEEAPAGAAQAAPGVRILGLAGDYTVTHGGEVVTHGGDDVIFGSPCTVDIDSAQCVVSDEGWVDVRGAANVVAPVNQVTIFDYEAPPSSPIRHRARAVKSTGIVGDWVYSEGPVQWEIGDGVWLKSLTNPLLNVRLKLYRPPAPTRPKRRGVFDILGADAPVVVHDVRGSRRDTWYIRTRSDDEIDALLEIIKEDVVLVQVPGDMKYASGYWSFGDADEDHLTRHVGLPLRNWIIPAVEVDAP